MAMSLTFSGLALGNPTCDFGEFIGTFAYNNDIPEYMAEIEDDVEDWFSARGITREVDFSSYAKVDDYPATTNGGLTVAYDPDLKTGTWATTDPIEFYTVKGGSVEFALYWMEGGATSGCWTTQEILNNGGNQPGISHLSTWNPLTPVVPAPA